MMGRSMLAVALLLLLPAAAAAEGAAETGRTDVILPAGGDFVLSFETPPGWSKSFYRGYNKHGPYFDYNSDERYGERPELLIVSFRHAEQPSISLRMNTYSHPLGLEDFAKFTRASSLDDTTLQAGFDRSFGRPWFTRTNSIKTGSSDPVSRQALTVFHDLVGIDGHFASHKSEFKDAAKAFKRIIQSVAVTPLADLDADTLRQLYVSPEFAVTPGGHWLFARFWLTMPPRWRAEELELVDRGIRSHEAGRIVVGFFPPGSSDETSFTVRLEGFSSDKVLSPEEFLATRDPIVAAMANHGREVKTEAGVEMPGESHQEGFCLSRTSTRSHAGSGRTEVKSYFGKDLSTGKDIKLRIHTAGGVTLACNLVFRASPEDFERLGPQVDEIVRSLKVEPEGPILMR